MNEDTPPSVMGASGGQIRRRSARLNSPQTDVKRSIIVKKIAPRKTVVPSEHNKENAHRLSEDNGYKKPKISTPDPVQAHRRGKATMPSPILASSPPPHHPQTSTDQEELQWSQKVRRSYSRLSNQSLNSPESRDTLFGFNDLKTPEVMKKKVALSKSGVEGVSGLISFTSLIEGDDFAPSFAEPDLHIPGVVVAKEKRRRRKKVQQMDDTEYANLAASMNAEFEEAEGFVLVVE